MPERRQPAISIILPVYNGARYLRDCLLSVQKQHFQNYELLIGDDASTDETPSIVADFLDPRWQYTRRRTNLGLFGNLNRLLEAAQAPLIHILCQDDLLEPDCLTQETALFEAHPDIGMFFSKFHLIDETGRECGRSPIDDLPVELPPHVSLQYFYYYGCLPGNLSTVCVSRRVLDQVGYFDESFNVAGDFDLWVRICKHSTLGVLHKYLVRLRNHPRQLSRSRQSYLAHVLETRRIRAGILSDLPAEIREAASRYTLMRQNVSDTHYVMRCLFEGRWNDSATIMRAMGTHDFAVGLTFWLASANNHVFQPTPRFTADAARF